MDFFKDWGTRFVSLCALLFSISAIIYSFTCDDIKGLIVWSVVEINAYIWYMVEMREEREDE